MAQTIDQAAFRDFERNAHDRLADSYHALFVPVTEHAVEPLLSAAKVGRGMRLLDVACGSGVIAQHAAKRRALVTGVDIAPRMLELAAKLNPECTFREASVESMPFEDGAFDALVCAFGIGHFPNPPAAVAECARVVRPAGVCAFTWWDSPAKNRMHGVLLAALEEVGPKPPADIPAGPPMFLYSEDQAFRALLETAGLRGVEIASHGFVWRLPDAEALWTACMGCMARSASLIRSQTPDVQERIHQAFIRHANKHLVASGLDLPMAFKVCAGTKPETVHGIPTN